MVGLISLIIVMSSFSQVTVKEAVSSVNKCIDNLTVKRADGKHVPWVCISCDELLIPRKAQPRIEGICSKQVKD